MPRIDDFFSELAAVRSFSAHRQQAKNRADAWTPEQAANMALAARMYPDLRPGALLAVGKGNYRADHPLVQQLADLSVKLGMRDHPGGIRYGQDAVTAAMSREQRMAMARAATGQQRTFLQDIRTAPVTEAVGGDKPRLSPEQVEAKVQEFADRLRTRGETPTDENLAAVREKYEQQHQTKFVRPDAVTLGPGPDTSSGGGSFLGELQQATGTQPTTSQRVMTSGPSEVAETAFTAPVRGTAMVFDAPVQELQGQVRNLYALAHGDPKPFWEPQSDLGVFLTSEFKETGNGFFVDPESEVAQERRRREAERGQIGGHNITLGRWAVDALTPFDPNTKPALILSGLVDAGVQIKADPTALALGQLGEARRAKALFAAAGEEQAAGIWKGLRWMVSPTDGAQFLDSDTGQDVLRVLAAERSPAAIWQTMNRKTPLSLAARLADATSPEDVRAILEPELGVRIRRVGDVTPLAGGTARPNPLRVMPTRGRIDAHDPDIVAWELDASMRNAGATEDKVRAAVDRVARAGDNPVKLNAAIRDSVRETGGLLDLAGQGRFARTMTPKVKSRLTRLVADAHKEASDTFRAQVTAQTPTYSEVMVSGRPVHDAGAHLWNELAPRWVTLPDGRAIRRNVSKYSWLLTTPEGEARLPTLALEHVVNDVWKPLQLIRAAWSIRVIGEEQLRMAAAGYDSMFNHPASYIAWRIGRKGTGDVIGDVIEESNQLKKALSVGHGGWADHAQVSTGLKTTFYKGNVHEQEQFLRAHASELARLSHDPVAAQVARSDSLDDAVQWFTRGAGNKFRGDLASAHPGQFDDLDQARAYLETVQQRIDVATGGNSDLLAAVKTGKLGGDDLISGTSLNGRVRARLEDYLDYAPDEIIGEETITLPSDAKSKLGQRMDRFVETMFSVLMTNRTNNLSRVPTFKQAYWREAERLVGFADEETKASIIRQAKANGIGSRAIRRMERTAARGEASLDEIDLAAKAHGLDETKTLLYDLSRRGRFMDAARLIFPFGEAWTELVTRWLGPNGLVANNPATVRRFQQAIQGARGEDFGEVMGAPEGKGFFWKNEFGEEVFVYPGSGLLTEKLLGVPIPLTGRVQGLNMFGSVVPGFGPAVQIPTGWLLANKPGPQWFKEALGQFENLDLGPLGTVEETLLPFGSAGQADQSELFSTTTYFPPYLKTAIDWAIGGDGHEKAWADTVMGYAAYLRSTGRYGNSKGDQQQLLEDAEHGARWFYLIKAIGQGTLPAAPAPDWQVVTPNDGTVRLRALTEEYAAMRAEDFEGADKAFLDRYGPDVLAAIQPKTKAAEYGLPTTKEGAQWVLDHPGVEDDLPHTYGFFAPAGGEFDYSLYDRQLREGDRVQLDGDVWLRLMNQTKAYMVLDEAKQQIEGRENSDDAREFMAETKAWLDDQYPGWRDTSGLPQRPELDVMVRELYDAVGNKAVKDTDAGKGLALYLEGRDQVLGWAEKEGHSRSDGLLSTSADVEDGHAYLRELAGWVIDRHPGFESLFDVVLSRELEEVE